MSGRRQYSDWERAKWGDTNDKTSPTLPPPPPGSKPTKVAAVEALLAAMRRRGPDILDELLDVLQEEETANAALIKKIREGEWAGPAVGVVPANLHIVYPLHSSISEFVPKWLCPTPAVWRCWYVSIYQLLLVARSLSLCQWLRLSITCTVITKHNDIIA